MIDPLGNMLKEINNAKKRASQNATFSYETTERVRPLVARGSIEKTNLFSMPIVAAKDLTKDVYNVKKGMQGSLDDHNLGRLNNLGLLLGGTGIASYLALKKQAPIKKLMEFVGFGTFFASMALWPKMFIQKPIEWTHGINIGHKYTDSEGRKKPFFLDPQYLPWDVYSHAQIEQIGDKMRIPKNIPNRQILTKEKAQKIAIQGNTLWMWTAGPATPLMTALACFGVEKYAANILAKMQNKSADKNLQRINILADKQFTQAGEKEFNEFINSLKGKNITREDIRKIAQTLTPDETLRNLITESLTTTIDEMQPVYDDIDVPKLLQNIENIEIFNKQGAKTYSIAYKDYLLDYLDDEKQVDDVINSIKNFFTQQNIQTLDTTNIDSIMKKLTTHLIQTQNIPSDDAKEFTGFFAKYFSSSPKKNLPAKELDAIKQLFPAFKKFHIKELLITQHFDNFVGEQEASCIANAWTNLSSKLIKRLGLTSSELKMISHGKNPDEIYVLINKKLNTLVTNPQKYQKTVEELSKMLASLNDLFNDDFISKSLDEYSKVYDELATQIKSTTSILDAPAGKLVGEQAQLLADTHRNRILNALGFSNEELRKIKVDNLSLERLIVERFEHIAHDETTYQATMEQLKKVVPRNFEGLEEIFKDIIETKGEKYLRTKSNLFHELLQSIDLPEYIRETQRREDRTLFNGIKALLAEEMPKTKLSEQLTTLSNDWEMQKRVKAKLKNIFPISDLEELLVKLKNADSSFLNSFLTNEGLNRAFIRATTPTEIKEAGATNLHNHLTNLIRERIYPTYARGQMKKAFGDGSLTYLARELAATSGVNGSYKEAFASEFIGRITAIKAHFYRTLQTLDFKKKLLETPDELRQRCAIIYKEVYKEAPTEEMVNKILKSCENILLNTGIVEQYDKLGTQASGAKMYKVIMELLYKEDFHPATLQEISDYNIATHLRKYYRSFLDTVANAFHDFKPEYVCDFANKPVAGASQKMNIVGLSIRDIVKNSSHSIFNTNKWFKLVGTAFAGLVGITLLTQTGFGKINLNTIQVTGDNK